ncbi:hypothetical protein RAC89_14215 [Paenibacillus sp. GD4]|nr:hypothetical protein [Paenibacillus sp. GD4]MDQ1911580.1 hypothetical protein [Paenibacillus sp. GD4]
MEPIIGSKQTRELRMGRSDKAGTGGGPAYRRGEVNNEQNRA